MFSAKVVRDRALPTPCRQGYKPNYIVSVCRWLLSGSNKSCTSHVCSLSESTSTLVYLVLLYEQRVTSETMHQARRSLDQVARCVYAGRRSAVPASSNALSILVAQIGELRPRYTGRKFTSSWQLAVLVPCMAIQLGRCYLLKFNIGRTFFRWGYLCAATWRSIVSPFISWGNSVSALHPETVLDVLYLKEV